MGFAYYPEGTQLAQQGFGGFNAGNAFDAWDLNPLAAQTGQSRDSLAQQRDQFLQPQYANYRAATKADQGDQELFGNADFQNYVRTGALPQNASPTQQWTAMPSAGGGDLMSQLMQRAQQPLNVSGQDATVRAQVDPLTAQMERSSRNYLDDVAERSGPLANLQGERRLAAERTGQAAGQLESEVIAREIAARRGEQDQAYNLWTQLYGQNQQLGFNRWATQLQDNARTADRSQAMDQFLRELALREYDTNQSWDYNWARL